MTTEPWLSAYGVPYDPRPAIEAWRSGDEGGPQELWEQLHHQGTVNSASYAAVGEIVRMMQQQVAPDWNTYALVACIEEARLADGNPPVPPALEENYRQAWSELLPLALRHIPETEDDLTVRAALAVVAHAKGQHRLGAIALCTEDERAEMLGR